ncbi:MAG: IgA Peptidase M64 [Bacteroidetes bacterium]|nr:IgA Peptidase M64 [Bacteroidota bacterium]
MKKALILFGLILGFAQAQAQFDKWFEPSTLRVDYVHAGNQQEAWFAFDEVLKEPFWGGSKTRLTDDFGYGNYRLEVFDLNSDSLIYSRGYSSLFGEWQTTLEAKAMSRSFNETVVMPFPKDRVRLVLSARGSDGIFERQFELVIDPKSYFIGPGQRLGYTVSDIEINALPEQAVDIVILPDGYTAAELEKFQADCIAFSNKLFLFAPFAENRTKFNIRAVMAPSAESGADIPAESIWKNTLLSSSFYTFDSERYCMTYDHKSVRDLAGNAPYDQIYILQNTTKYGGGGIFNFYSLSSSSNKLSAEIIVHEFGHSFAGLGDEYFDSSTSYNDFYNPAVEPWEPNLTSLVDFDNKWKHLIGEEIPVPTPPDSAFYNKTGVFEGGGYVAKGIYRPSYDCLMHTFKGHTFCAACSEAIVKMINFYAE